jgi:glycosyltransferase involved in cell wall biosynthesis
MEKTVYRNADRVSAVTSFMAEYAENMGAKKQNISVLSLGANPEVFFPQDKSPELQQKLGISSGDKAILFVGTLFDFTGLSQVIRALPKLLDRIPCAKLVIVGGGPSFNNLKKVCADARLEKHVLFTGFVNYSEIPAYINTSDLCINPFEVNYITDRIIPAKLIEYLSCGKPVVSTPLKGALEMLPSMTSGVMYSDKGDFVETMSSLLNNPDLMKEMGSRGREYVAQKYSWQSIANRILSEMEDARAKAR